MVPRRDSVGESYDFLVAHEDSGQPFTLDELCASTGWKIRTPEAYLSKKWPNWVSAEGDRYLVSGLRDISKEQYRRHMSQVQDVSREPSRPILLPNVELLVLKAQEAASLAIDVYNRPQTRFRSEGYLVLMVVAWTALLHAIFELRGVDYTFRDSNGAPILVDDEPKSLPLSDCLAAFFQDGTPPTRRNLEFVIGLRNKIEHRYVPGIDPHVAGECQALLLNFEELITTTFGEYFSLIDALHVPLQTSTLRSTARSIAVKKLEANNYDEVMEYIDVFRDSLPDSVYGDPRFSFRVYLVPKLGNHASSSDVAFEFVKYDPNDPEDSAVRRAVALIKDRQVQVANAGKYKPSQVARQVAERLGRPFNVHLHTQAWKAYEVRAAGIQPDLCKTDYCQFDTVHEDYVYTDAWVSFLVERLADPDEYQRVMTFRGPSHGL